MSRSQFGLRSGVVVGAVIRSLAAAVLLVSACAAAGPQVSFDLAPKAACRPVSGAEAAKLHPGANVVEVTFDLSTRVSGNEADLKQITIEIWSPDRELSIVGYSPSTTLQSEAVDGVIEVEQHQAFGALSLEYALPTAKIQASAKNAGDSKVTEKKLAPKNLLLASGTFDRSHGVFFTLHPSSQESLQKSRQFVCQLEVPPGFRGDYLQLTCSALARKPGVVHSLDSEVTAGSARFTIGIYLDGDSQARRAAETLAEKQLALARVAARAAEAGRAQPHHWWDAVGKTIQNVSHTKPAKTSAPLADEVAQAAAEIQDAQQALRALNGTSAAK